MIHNFFKNLFDDNVFKIGILGTSISFSFQNIDIWASVFASVATTIYVVLKTIMLFKNDKKQSKKE